MLISTLISVTLLMGLTLTLQAQTLASMKLAKRLATKQAEAVRLDAVRELMRPVIGESMLRFDEDPPMSFDGTGYITAFEGQQVEVQAEVVKPRGFVVGNGAQPKEVLIVLR